jgi:hypothetical protein
MLGCASLSANGEKVQLTMNPNDVTKCKSLGAVSADPPFGVPDDWKVKLRNEAGELGADHVLASNPGIGSVPGQAYDCRQQTAAQ